MRLRFENCDLGLTGGRFGACAVDTDADAPRRPPLSAGQRLARAAAGVGFLGIALPLLRRRPTRAPGAVAAWFGATHLLAAATAFNGCPELGAAPSLVLRRDVASECGPWELLDRRLGLAAPAPPVAEAAA